MVASVMGLDALGVCVCVIRAWNSDHTGDRIQPLSVAPNQCSADQRYSSVLECLTLMYKIPDSTPCTRVGGGVEVGRQGSAWDKAQLLGYLLSMHGILV